MSNPKMNLILEGLVNEGKKIKFEYKTGMGSNPDVLKLSNGDEIQIKGMSYQDKGSNKKNLKSNDNMEQHYTEQFVLKGVGNKSYNVIREVIIYKDGVKGSKFKSNIVSVEEVK